MNRWLVRAPAIVGLFIHPTHGPTLIDTGYAPRFFDQTRNFPGRLYAMATPVHLPKEEELALHLARHSLHLSDIRTVILTHWHADHIAGLLDLPLARIYGDRASQSFYAHLNPLSRIRHAYLSGLVPEDLPTRLQEGTPCSLPYNLGQGEDVFGDGLAQLVPLPGHTKAQRGLLLQTHRGPVFMIADACWQMHEVLKPRRTHPLASIAVEDTDVAHQTLLRLHQLHAQHPELTLIPSHCQLTLNNYQRC